jgi:hypothetical protein
MPLRSDFAGGAFLSQPVAAMLYGAADPPQDGDSVRVFEGGSFNWQLFSLPVPPPEDVGEERGLYIAAARYLRHIAGACEEFLRTPGACEMLEGKLGGQRCHASALQYLVRAHASCACETQGVERQGHQTAPLLLCCIIERSLFDLYHHRRACREAGAGKAPTMLREILENPLIVDCFPPAAAGLCATSPGLCPRPPEPLSLVCSTLFPAATDPRST